MSRCFPFPPPGYERKHRPEDLGLLKEAKSKERKHKKDKERKKDKEKREKDGGAEDKKDRKEKHREKKEKRRDKKEKKDRGAKDKEKSSISEESSVSKISETKLSLVGNSKDRGNFLNEGKYVSLSQSSLLPSQGNEESKFVLELDRRIRDEKSSGSQLPERVDQKDRGFVRNSSDEKGDKKNERVDKQMDPRGHEIEMVQDLMPIVESKGEGIPRPLNEENGMRLENKDMYNETVGVKRGDKQKEKSKESHGKEKNKEKEYDKAKLKTGNKKSDQEKLKDDGSSIAEFAGNQSTDMSKGVSIISVNDGNFKKRKDMGTNGFFHESEIRPNKMQRPAPHQWTENGMKHETFRTPIKPSNGEHAVPNRVQADKKDQLLNGTHEARKPSLSKSNHPTADMTVFDQTPKASKLPQHDPIDLKKAVTVLNMAGPVAEASRRSPHPDSKYLAEVLTVPRNVEWSEYDDQDWLFSEKVKSKSKPTSGSLIEDVFVWSEAVRIESVDLCALPYVIPY